MTSLVKLEITKAITDTTGIQYPSGLCVVCTEETIINNNLLQCGINCYADTTGPDDDTPALNIVCIGNLAKITLSDADLNNTKVVPLLQAKLKAWLEAIAQVGVGNVEILPNE